MSPPFPGLNTLSPHIRLARYEGARLNDHWCAPVASGGSTESLATEFVGSRWRIDVRSSDVPRCVEARDYFITTTLLETNAKAVGFAIEFHVGDWTRENFVVLPGAVYDGNRFNCRPKAGYPPIAALTGDTGPDAPITIADIPRLPVEGGRGRVQLLSADLATPAVGYFDPARRMGVWFLTPQATRCGLTGLDVEEDLALGAAILRVSAPGVREETRYHCFQTDRPSLDRAPDWLPNESALLHVRAYVFPCEDRLAFLAYFAGIRADLCAPASPRAGYALSSARALIEEKYNRDNWHAGFGIYATDTLRGRALPDWQAGWIGGGMVNYPLLAQGGEESRSRSRRTLDYICTEGVAASGFFRSYLKEGVWTDDSFGKAPAGQRWHMTRKSADLLLFLLKQIDWVRRHPERSGVDGVVGAPGTWETAARGCADAFVRLWLSEGQIGQFVDEESGALLVGGSESAAIVTAALALAAPVLGDPAYLVNAKEIGEHFWTRFQRQGFTTGGPGEILSAPDSESAFGLLEGFVALWEQTGEAVWLERAEFAAAYCATWCVSYDFVFPTNSTFGAMQMASTGTVIANVQNKHSSPGICTLSGDSLFRLYRATGNPLYLRLVREIATSLPQYVSREDRPILARYGGGATPPGWMCERVNLSDWLEPVGEIFPGSCWCEVSLMLTALELPTVYVRTDKGLVVALDNVEARLVGAGVLAVTNPTEFSIEVRVFAEGADAVSERLPLHAFADLPAVTIPAGATVRHVFSV